MTKPSVAAMIAVTAAVLGLAAVVLGGCSESQRIAAEVTAVSSPPSSVPVTVQESWLDRRLEGYFDPEEVATMSRDQKAICLEAVREMEGLGPVDKEEVKKKSKK